MSLANRYRPDRFDSVVWQSHIIDILKAKITRQDDSSNNYIFYWPRWTGKTSVARLFAKAINAQKLDENAMRDANDPVVEAIDKWRSLDYIEIDAASHTWVDNIREEILAKVPYPPTQLKKKVYVIDEVHMLSTWAFNALLKTIEEPQEYLVFILATTEIHKVPDTIISRCHVFNFRKIPTQEMVEHLSGIAQKENIQYEDQALEIIANMSDGCVRDAVKYLDQISILWTISVDNVSKFLWVASENTIRDFIKTIVWWDRNRVFEFVDQIQNNGIDLYNFAKQIVQYIDKHLMENIDGYLKISEACSEILSSIRYYPYPAIVYKIALNKILLWNIWTNTTTNTGTNTNVNSNASVNANTIASTNINTAANAANANVGSNTKIANEDINTSTTKTSDFGADAKLSNDDSKSIENNDVADPVVNNANESNVVNTNANVSNIDSTNTANNTDVSNPDTTNDSEANAEETNPNNTSSEDDESKNESSSNTNSKINSNDNYKQLTQDFINRIDKTSMRWQFQDNVYIQDIQSNKVILSTINTMAKMLLDKQDNVQYIESILSELIWRKVSIEVSFVKKEQLLESMLG